MLQTAQAYRKLYNRKRKKDYSKYHGYAYDGIWVIAKAIDNVLHQTRGRFNMDDFRSPSFQAALNDTSFRGVTVSSN